MVFINEFECIRFKDYYVNKERYESDRSKYDIQDLNEVIKDASKRKLHQQSKRDFNVRNDLRSLSPTKK